MIITPPEQHAALEAYRQLRADRYGFSPSPLACTWGDHTWHGPGILDRSALSCLQFCRWCGVIRVAPEYLAAAIAWAAAQRESHAR